VDLGKAENDLCAIETLCAISIHTEEKGRTEKRDAQIIAEKRDAQIIVRIVGFCAFLGENSFFWNRTMVAYRPILINR